MLLVAGFTNPPKIFFLERQPNLSGVSAIIRLRATIANDIVNGSVENLDVDNSARLIPKQVWAGQAS